MKKISFLIYTTLLLLMFSIPCKSQIIRLFTGRYTKTEEKGFNIFDLNPGNDGTFKLVSESDAGPNPSYFCISGKHGNIYAVNEVTDFNGIRGGGVTTLSYDAVTGITKKLNEFSVPDGSPCFISLSASEDFIFMANYTGGSVTVAKLDKKGIPAGITENIIFGGEKGTVSHAHMISTDPSGKRVYVTDLGLDRIVIYNLDTVTGKLHQIQNGIVKLAKGAGPRHFVFNREGTRMYVICELNSTVWVFDVNSKGELKPLQTLSTLAEGFKGESFCADIHIGKDGKFLYGSNRGENTIVTFSITSDGTLIPAGRTPCGGDWPRNFVIDPSGKYLIVGNQKSGNISLFRIDEKSGIPAGPDKEYKLTTPACLRFLN
jgi:6-phosphogluconolactonase